MQKRILIDVRKWRRLFHLLLATSAFILIYSLLTRSPTLLLRQNNFINHFIQLQNTSLQHWHSSGTAIMNATALMNTTTAVHLFYSHPRYMSWTKGVVTQLHPIVKKNCTKLMNGDKVEVAHVAETMLTWKGEDNSTGVFSNVSDCGQIENEFYNDYYVSAEERAFPIAYVLIVYTNPQQIVRFLRAVYRPHNLYCIHPDLKSGKAFSAVFYLLSRCLPNVFIPSQIQEVHYARGSIFEAQLSCYQDLDKYPADKWHYVINLCGRELPLRTNHEIVNYLKAMNGTSIIRPSHVDNRTLHERFHWKQRTAINYKHVKHNKPLYTSEELGRPPFDIQLYKSSSYNALSRVFVHFFLHSQTVQSFMQWIKHAWVPEEHFYASVYMMPWSPGGHSSLHPITSLAVVSKAIWRPQQSHGSSEKCPGKRVHQICILTSTELPLVKNVFKENVWFLNKYFMEDDHVIMDCVEEVLVRKNVEEFHQDSRFLTYT